MRSSGCWPAWDRDILHICLMPQEQNCDLCGLFVQTRALYAPFESDLRSSSSDVYYHEMPGGQYTNLKFQVTALSVLNGLACVTEAGRCVCVLRPGGTMYVNRLDWLHARHRASL